VGQRPTRSETERRRLFVCCRPRRRSSLRRWVAPVYVAGPGSVPGIEHDVDQVGAMTGNATAGAALVGRMQAGLRTVSKATAGLPPVPIRWVLTRDPEGKRSPKALFSTDQTQTAEQIVP